MQSEALCQPVELSPPKHRGQIVTKSGSRARIGKRDEILESLSVRPGNQRLLSPLHTQKHSLHSRLGRKDRSGHVRHHVERPPRLEQQRNKALFAERTARKPRRRLPLHDEMSVGGRVRIARELGNGVGGDVERQIGKYPVFRARRDARQKVGAAYLDVWELGRSVGKRPNQPIVDLVRDKGAAALRQQSRDVPRVPAPISTTRSRGVNAQRSRSLERKPFLVRKFWAPRARRPDTEDHSHNLSLLAVS